MRTEEKEEHESFGLLSLARISHSADKINLFGSTIRHGQTILLSIFKASKHRAYNRDSYFAKEKVIEVEMSPVQFSEAITSFNIGSGTPVTIKSICGERYNYPPPTDIRQKFEDEFKSDLKRTNENSLEAIKKVRGILAQKTIKKSDLTEVLSLLVDINNSLASNTEFVYHQFNAQIDKSISEAKGEIEAFIENKVRSTGLDSISKSFDAGSLLEHKENSVSIVE
jgi:hypothetical protein